MMLRLRAQESASSQTVLSHARSLLPNGLSIVYKSAYFTSTNVVLVIHLAVTSKTVKSLNYIIRFYAWVK